MIISLIVLRNNCLSCESELSTKLNTLYKKKSGLPMDIFPRAIEAAVLTSSFELLNKPDTVSIRLFKLDKSVNLPSSPKHKAPFN